MRLVKTAVNMGNGAAIYIPKEYEGREIVVVLPEGIEEVKRRIISKLIPYMKNIVGVYLFGSYARGENKAGSDIDILIITKEKAGSDIRSLFPESEYEDARFFTIESIENSIDTHPALIVPILREAEILVNPVLIEELRKKEFSFSKFKWEFEDIKSIIKIIEEFINLDPKDIAISHIYSLIMRARVLYMIESLLRNKIFSNSELRKEMIRRGLKPQEFDEFYQVYQEFRGEGEVEGSIEKEKIVKLISIVKRYAKETKNEAKKKSKKRT
jgi:predicted nucleotidyltransferase